MGNTTSCCVSSSPKLRRNAHSRLESYRPEAELSREDTGCNLQHISDRENIDGERGPGEPPHPFPSPPLRSLRLARLCPGLPRGWGRPGRSRCPGTAGLTGMPLSVPPPELLLCPGERCLLAGPGASLRPAASSGRVQFSSAGSALPRPFALQSVVR